MKTQIANSTKSTSASRLTRIASLAALFLTLCVSSAWAQNVTVINPVSNPVRQSGVHEPQSYLFSGGEVATFGVPDGERLVIENVNILLPSTLPWMVWLKCGLPNNQRSLTFFGSPTSATFPSGFSYGVTSSSARMFVDNDNVCTFSFFDGNNAFSTVPIGVNVQVFGYLEPSNQNTGRWDDF